MIKQVCLFSKKATLAAADFKAYYETRHVPLVLNLIPIFADYRRNYVSPKGTVARSHVAAAPLPGFDVITEVWFENQASVDAATDSFKNPAVADAIARDEENFFDRRRMTLFAMQEYITLPEQLGSAIRAPDDGTMVKVVVMVKRKPGMSREAFIEYYETQHALLVAKHLRMFAGYRRSYMIPGSLVQLAHIAQVASPPDFDVMTEVWLRTHADFESLVTTIANPEIGRMLAEDEANLFDRSTIRMFRVEECVTPKAAIERAKRATAS